ncbi:proline-serine-threonine phosphatase-interacting protein 1-like [Sycon ciliatum]|uniref:proline-serine-threonine phosphatase-interacting protein 1-like n=1 Tax=Sycon ciliatum TaxID=27933 RepID=UPI0031F6ED31
MSYNFVDHFWELDFTGVTGYDVLVKRLKDGKKMTQDFEDFIRARAKLEETYSKELMKLVKNSHGETEIGSLRASWDCLKSETEACSREHLSVSQRLNNELEKSTKEFREKQRDTRKKAEETVKRAQGFKKSSYQSETKAKQEYHSKCRAADKAEEVASKSGHLQPKKIEELKMKAKKARQASELADQSYQEAVKNLDEARLLWEREMEVACKVFQDLEEERVLFLRQMMWKHCNVYSSLAVRDDEVHEAVRCSLEQCDADSDLTLFVQQKRTGSDRPVPIEYENFYGNNPPQSIRPSAARVNQANSHQAQGAAAGAPMQARTLPRVPGQSDASVNPHMMRPPADIPQPTLIAIDDGAYSSVPQGMQQQHHMQAAMQPQPQLQVQPQPQHHPGHHNGGMPPGARAGMGQCRANFPYEAQGPEELTFMEGEIITIVMKEDGNWWRGDVRGRQGMFPCNYVTEF